MSSFLGVPVDAAYHVVSALVSFLTPALGGIAAAVAIVTFTIAIRIVIMPLSYRAIRGMDAQARMAPKVAALRQRFAAKPEALRRELAKLYQSEGTTMFAGCLPVLLQWPFLSVMYLLFRSPTIAGGPNALLSHGLFGAQLGSYWLGAAGPFSLHGAVFAGLFVLLAVLGWLSARLARTITRTAASTAESPANPAATATEAIGAASTALTAVMPYLTVAFAAFIPLAGGLYLLTTTAWTLGERRLLRRRGPATGAAT